MPIYGFRMPIYGFNRRTMTRCKRQGRRTGRPPVGRFPCGLLTESERELEQDKELLERVEGILPRMQGSYRYSKLCNGKLGSLTTYKEREYHEVMKMIEKCCPARFILTTLMKRAVNLAIVNSSINLGPFKDKICRFVDLRGTYSQTFPLTFLILRLSK